MGEFNEYVFIFRNGNRTFDIATNPVFIAAHKDCKAILKTNILEKFDSVRDFVRDLNSFDSEKSIDIWEKA